MGTPAITNRIGRATHPRYVRLEGTGSRRTHAELRDAENDLVEALRSNPRDPTCWATAHLHTCGRFTASCPRTFTFGRGDLRQSAREGGRVFARRAALVGPFEHVAAEIYQLDRLRAVDSRSRWPGRYRYDYVSGAHRSARQRPLDPRVLRSPVVRTRLWPRLGKTAARRLSRGARQPISGLVAMFRSSTSPLTP